MNTSTRAPRALVVGAANGSLGAEVDKVLEEIGYAVSSAGIGDEDLLMDATSPLAVRETFEIGSLFDTVVCTVGVNTETDLSREEWVSDVLEDLEVNLLAPLTVLQGWLSSWEGGSPGPHQRHFVFVSSNSAHVARSTSLGYCASKAALSMATRCAARALAGTNHPPAVWAVEPGWIDGTPMSNKVTERLGPEISPHRIPGGRGMNRTRVAHFIAQNIAIGGYGVNGCTFRLDGGEQ